MSKQSIAQKSAVIRNETQKYANKKERISDILDDLNESKADLVGGKLLDSQAPQILIDKIEQLQLGSNLGFITPATPSPPNTGIYRGQATQPGTYFGGTVVTPEVFEENFVFIEVKNGVVSLVPIKKPAGVNVSPKFDATSETNAQGGKQIFDFLEDVGSGDTINVYLNKYTGANDPTLLNGSISTNYDYQPINNGGKVGMIDIPQGTTMLLGFDFDLVVYFQFTDDIPSKRGGGITSDTNIIIPAGSTRIYFTAKSGESSQNFATNHVKFAAINSGRNPYVRKNDVFKVVEKPTLLTQEKKLNTFVTSFDDPTLLNGIIDNNGNYHTNLNDNKVLAIPIVAGAKYLMFNLSIYVFWQLVNLTVKKSFGTTKKNEIVPIPDGSTHVVFTIKTEGVFVADLAKDSVIFGFNSAEYLVKSSEIPKLLKDNYLGKIMLGTKQYTFAGDDFRIYQENVFSGFKPRENFNIQFIGASVLGNDGDKGRYCEVKNAGELTVKVFDTNRNLLQEKKTTVFKKNKPTQINQSFNSLNKLQVLFIGDSLFHFNENLIGKEWLRMLNINAPNETILDDVVYLPTHNLGGGNIQLVGELGSSDNKFEIGNSLSTLMKGSNSGGTVNNPFFNPGSPNANEVDANGWNKKVDISWYFQKICGVGKFPKFIYLACGVNDIVEFNWDINALPLIRLRLKAVLLKIKQACDAIAGGNSGVKILVVNHQFYPLNGGHEYDFEPAKQRHIWAEHYTEYENLILTDPALNTFVRFVDCASSFDIDFGYGYDQKRVNPRNVQSQSNVIDTVHIGESGSLMYADGLLRDFLYNECS